MTSNSSAIVKRVAAKSGHRDADRFQPSCPCGWTGPLYSNRTIEGRRLARRDATQHRCEVSA